MRDNDLMSWYTVYNAKTDEIVACGTADMIVRQMGYVNKNSLYSAVTHSKIRKGPPPRYFYHVQKVRREWLEKVFYENYHQRRKRTACHLLRE